MRVDKLVPDVYYRESRDFSYVGRIFEVLLNYMKTGADLVNAPLNSENVKGMILDLLISTLGFESKHEYITKDLIYIASAFSELLRKKGTQEAIEEALVILLTSQNLELDVMIEPSEADHTLFIVVPEPLKDVILFEDLLQYIIPAGLLLDIRFGTQTKTTESDEVELNDYVTMRKVSDKNIGKVYTGDIYDLEEGIIPVEHADELTRALFTSAVIVTDIDDNPADSKNFANNHNNIGKKG